MKIEDIEKAAQDYDDGLIYSSVKEQYDVIKAFKAVAEYRINSVWHKMNIEPRKNELIVLHGNGNTVTILWNGDMRWDGMDNFFKAEIWAYMSDLIPDTEE